MEAWDLYWITRLDGIIGVTILFMVLWSVGVMFWFMFHFDPSDITIKGMVKWITPSLLSGLFLVFIPTSKEVMTFIAVDVITHEEKVIDTADKLYEVLDGYLDSKIEEQKGEK